jgi:hypothetical protein
MFSACFIPMLTGNASSHQPSVIDKVAPVAEAGPHFSSSGVSAAFIRIGLHEVHRANSRVSGMPRDIMTITSPQAAE